MLRLRKHGFTLVELMIVVAIIGVLAVVAGTAYRRYMDSGRTAEAMAMLGEIRAKEEAYRAEFSSYTGNWAFWQALGINPGKQQLYCGYIVNSGLANVAVTGTMGSDLIKTNNNGSATPATPWWYAIAMCDNDGKSGTNATFATAYDTTVVSAQNEHK